MRKNLFAHFSNFHDPFSLWISNIVSGITSAAFWFYLATMTDKSELGEIGYFISLGAVGFLFANSGLSGVIIIYGAKKENVFSTTYALGLISGIVTSIIFYILTENLALVFLIFTDIIWMLWESKLTAEKRFSSFAKYTVTRRVLMLIFAFLLYPSFGLDGILWGFGISTIPGFIGMYYFLKDTKINFSILKPKVKFMFNFYAINITSNIFWWGDKILIGSLLGFSVLGSYQLATQFVILLNTIPAAIYQYLLPQEAQGIPNKKLKIYSVILAFILSIVSIIVIPNAVNAFFPNFDASIIPMQIMSISIIPLMISVIYEPKFLGTEKSKFVLIGSSIQTGIYFIFILFIGIDFGLIGLSLVFLFSIISRSIYNIVIAKYVIQS